MWFEGVGVAGQGLVVVLVGQWLVLVRVERVACGLATVGQVWVRVQLQRRRLVVADEQRRARTVALELANGLLVQEVVAVHLVAALVAELV